MLHLHKHRVVPKNARSSITIHCVELKPKKPRQVQLLSLSLEYKAARRLQQVILTEEEGSVQLTSLY
jgi:hypothetical protein